MIVLKCISLLPANPALLMVEITALLVVKSADMLAVSGTPVSLKKQFALVGDTYKIVTRLFEWAKTYSNAG